MDIGIIADTHDNVAAVDAAIGVFSDRSIDVLIHCGDFIAPPVIRRFDGFELHGVLGNNDGEVDGLHAAFDAIGSGSTLHGEVARITIDGRSIVALHGEDRDHVDSLAQEEDIDLLCYGHHHRRDDRTVEGTRVCNPGAHFPTVPSPHRTVAVYDTTDESITFEPVESM